MATRIAGAAPCFRGPSLLLRNSPPLLVCRLEPRALLKPLKASCECQDHEPQSREEYTPGVKLAVALLAFYKNEVSPLLPGSCRFVPTCSEYATQAYKKYGTLKGTILTIWRLLRCNPFGPSGFDPPRWFGEE